MSACATFQPISRESKIMGPDRDQVSSILSELADQKVLTQYINRGPVKPKEDTARNRALKILSPLRASELRIPLSEKFAKLPDDLKSSQELIARAQSLAASIEQVTDPAALEIMAPLLEVVELDERPETDKFLSIEVHRALGYIALHKSLQLAIAHSEEVKPYGVVKDYLDGVRGTENALSQLAVLVEKFPIMGRSAQEIMSPDQKWVEQDETIERMKHAEELEISLASYLKLIPKLKKGLTYSHIWQREGLSPENIPTVNITSEQIMILSRFYAWAELAEDTPEDEREIAFESWKHDKENLLSLAAHLSNQEKSQVRIELATIEDALFEPINT